MAKKVAGQLKLQVPAGKANPAQVNELLRKLLAGP